MVSQKRVLLAWWGAMDGDGETIGDLFAVWRVAVIAQSVGYAIDFASRYRCGAMDRIGASTVKWAEVNPDDYDLLCFVCGPIVYQAGPFQDLIERFHEVKKLAIGVSILPANVPGHGNPFDFVLARDGLPKPVGDIAFDPRELRDLPAARGNRVGLCFRGAQSEYGDDACRDVRAEAIANRIARTIGGEIVLLDTRLFGHPDQDKLIVDTFATCRFVVSTRLHGSLLSLALGRPAVAIDQTCNGAKVYQALNRIEWPYLLRADTASDADIEFVERNIVTEVDATQVRMAQKKLSDQIDSATNRIRSVLVDLRDGRHPKRGGVLTSLLSWS